MKYLCMAMVLVMLTGCASLQSGMSIGYSDGKLSFSVTTDVEGLVKEELDMTDDDYSLVDDLIDRHVDAVNE